MSTTSSPIDQEDLHYPIIYPKYPKLEDSSEANVLWDEYKYRHDLIWRHLIRSTLALITLVTIAYTDIVKTTCWLIVFAWLVALGYWVIVLYAVKAELRLYIEIKRLHRERQNHFFGLKNTIPQANVGTNWGAIFRADHFAQRVGAYLALLFIGIILAGFITLFDPGLTFCK